MFGLMRQRGCAADTAGRQRHRLHYCGTCKTLGVRHGQLSRWLLNHDTVFLAELLDALVPLPGPAWHPAYASRSCLSLPDKQQGQPLVLRLAAALTVLMAGFKLRDRVEDRGGLHWRWLERRFRRRFIQASEELRGLGVAVDRIAGLLAEQQRREQGAVVVLHEQGVEAALAHVAAPTADTTALVMSQGMTLLGCADLQESGAQLGHRFGTLIYLLDAWDDYADDRRSGAFNALGLVHGNPAEPGAEVAAAWRARLWALAGQLRDDLAALPMPAASLAAFQARLRINLAQRLESDSASQKDQQGRKRRRDKRDTAGESGDCCCDACVDCPHCTPRCCSSRGSGGCCDADGGCCNVDGCGCDGCNCGCDCPL